MTGFTVSKYVDQYPQAISELTTWFQEGKLIYEMKILNGFEEGLEALDPIFNGQNQGKMVVRVSSSSNTNLSNSKL